jgi:hypothetical protein
MATEKQEKPYDGWLVSNNFWKRAFAIWGHYVVANAIFGLTMFILFLIISLSTFGLFWSNNNFKNVIKNEITNSVTEDLKINMVE